MEKEKFEQLYKLYAPMLYRVAYRMVKNYADAMDIVQEAFIRIYNSYDRFKEASHIKTWMYRIVMNLCYDYFRKKKKVSTVSDQEFFDPEKNKKNS